MTTPFIERINAGGDRHADRIFIFDRCLSVSIRVPITYTFVKATELSGLGGRGDASRWAGVALQVLVEALRALLEARHDIGMSSRDILLFSWIPGQIEQR